MDAIYNQEVSAWYARRQRRGPRKIAPVPEAHIDAICRHLHVSLLALVDLQLAYGARPDELAGLRRHGINMVDHNLQEASLTQHKTA